MQAQPRKCHGFTIVELMVSLAVAAILVGMAVPAFTGFIEQRTMSARANDFLLAVTYARSEAARRGSGVSVHALGSDDDNEWGEGFCVVAGNPGNCDAPLRSFDAVSDDLTFDGRDAFDSAFTLTFDQRGMLTFGSAGSVALCSTDADTDPGRVVNVSRIGRAEVDELECHP
ncbi:MAG: GspH/FimT family pseudopilin [Pseudomonadota bacterium]